MAALTLCIAILVVFGAIHMGLWRSGRVQRTVSLLVANYGIAVVSVLSLASVVWGLPESLEVVRAILASGAVFLVYLSMYMAVERDSASSRFLLEVERAGPNGVSCEALRALLCDEDMVVSRLQGLKGARFVYQRGESFFLTRRGQAFLWAIRSLRRVFTDRPVGG